jgi:sugar lactone lactonase YvrE
MVKKLSWIVVGSFAALAAHASDLRISSFVGDGTLTVTNTFTNGVVTVEKTSTVDGHWLPEKNVFSLGSIAQLKLALSGDTAFFRALAVDLSGGDTGFTNLTESYGLLSTIAGSGASSCTPCNNWQPAFEGGPATNAALSHPHIAMADRAGNIYIADKEAHAIRKVTPDGNIFTVAGTGVAGRGDPYSPAPATEIALNNPNGLWVRADGTFYILDRDNGLIRKVDTNGIMSTLVDSGFPMILGGRGLWVSPDESLLFYSAATQVMSYDTTNGLVIYASGFLQLGNLAIDPNGNLVVTDRLGFLVYRIASDGTKTVIAGNGYLSGGGDGQLATDTGLAQVRGIWFLLSGAYFLATDTGSQVWYVDTDGYIHLLLNGTLHAHSGDGSWFYDDPTSAKIGAVRQITMDYDGNLLITENDAGYVRKVQFLRLSP